MIDNTNALNIHNYTLDGFKKVCDIKISPKNSKHWYYENIDQSIMYADHKSWVYFIVENDEIIKVGETGNPLGIRKNSHSWYNNNPQPLSGSKCRLGRYINGDQTDADIRETLFESINNNNKLSFWAKQCTYIVTPFTIWGNAYGNSVATIHKDLEKKYLDFIVEEFGTLPRLNKGRA